VVHGRWSACHFSEQVLAGQAQVTRGAKPFDPGAVGGDSGQQPPAVDPKAKGGSHAW
jgi:hypothetical protein